MAQDELFHTERNGYLTEGEKRKADGIARVDANESKDWKYQFRAAVMSMPYGKEFTSESITAIVGQPPHHPNSVGAQMNALARAKAIVLVRFDKAHRSNQHATRIGVWVRIG